MELILQIFWGLLACEILNQKERGVVENTTLKRIREITEKMFNEYAITKLEHFNQKTCLLHWILIYSFTNNKPDSEGLFAQMVTDRLSYGHQFLNIIQIKCPYLLRYLIASLLLQGNITKRGEHVEYLSDICLSAVLSEKPAYSDSFT